MVGDTILIKDISINGNDNLTNADQLSETLTDNTINALGIDASSRTIWINGQPYGNAYVNVKEGGTLEKPIGGEIFNDFEHNIASGEYSHAEGHVTSATNANAHAEGAGTTASGIASHSEGYYSTASGTVSHAEGYQTTATKTASHAEGQNTKAIGSVSHAEGYNTIASASYSHAEGSQSVASGQSSHAEGTETKATNDSAHAEGYKTIASRYQSHAEGNQTSAAGVCSHAEGFKTQTTNKGEHAEGLSNVSIQGKTVHTVGIGSAEDNVEDRKNAEEIHLDGKHYVYGIGGYDGTNSEDDDVKTVQTVVNESINQITISYLKLKELRDASQLVPGKEYRINDYTCTTTQTGTRSAGNVFDIIVTADSESTLNEEARAINHEFDAPNQDHFKNCNLNAWQIWYCLDNDTTRFAWADATNGKGVIYRMIDEWNNDVPYDFKNIQFKRYILDANNAIATDVVKDGELNVVKAKLEVMSHRIHTNLWYYGSYVSGVYPAADENTKYVPFGDVFYNGEGPGVLCPINEENFEWFYTFSDNSFNDVTLTIQGYVHNNVIKSNKQLLLIIDGEGRYSFEEQEGICLNDIIFIGNNCYSNFFGNNCYSNSLGNYCHSNSFGNNCHLNSLGNYCHYNSLGNYCHSNSLGNYCHYNSLGNYCHSNSLGNYCYSNTFRNNCYSNSFGNNCYGNTFGNYCNFNSFGNDCYSNTFRNNCYSNSFRNKYYSNSFGNYCYSNSFGNNCHYNSLGNDCYSIKFASSTSASTKYDYYRYNHFGDGCQYIVFKGTETASDTQQVQNYNFAQGLQGTSSAYLTIDGVRNRAYETYISRDTDGSIKESVIADKLDKMIEIEYLDLLYLRDFGELIPGQQYRIIDYDTIVNETDTVYKSAHNLFDIIVTADSHNKLNEVARAINHNFIIPYDDHFNNCNLSAWKIWYSLDNDATLFDWAANTMPKLVIKYTDSGSSVLKTAEYVQIIFAGNKKYGLWRITDTPEVYIGTTTIDIGASVDRMQIENHVWTVVQTNYGMISKRITDGGKGVIYRMIDEFNNDIPYDFKNIQFKYPNDTETYTYYYYTFASDNTENNNDYSLDKSNECHSNTIKPYIKITSTGKQMQLNRIMFIGGRGIVRNTFGNNCYGNAFNYACSNNTFGDRCSYNIFGTDCSNNVFGNDCVYNIFRNDCSSNNFGNGCCYNIFDTDYFYFNNIDNWVKYVHVTANPTTTISKLATNYHITSSVKGIRETTDGRQNILVSPGRSYITTVDMDSGGTVKYYCVADLLNNWEPTQPK